MEWLAELQGLDPVQALRRSRWVYPVVNSGHIFGIAALFGSILALDLRLLGAWRSLPATPLARLLTPLAAGGFALAAVTGLLLFSVGATDYAGQQLFLAKMILILLALANVAAQHGSAAWRRFQESGEVPARLKVGAGLSLALWASVIFCGRFLGYI